jgi:tyrosyl-tRNA synthetase
MTEMVHGKDVADEVERACEVLFAGGDVSTIKAEYLEDALSGAPVVDVERARLEGEGLSLVDVVALALYPGEQKRGQAKRDIAQDKSISLNGAKVVDPERRIAVKDLLHGKYLVVRKGKKTYALVRAV